MDILETIKLYSDFAPASMVSAVDIIGYVEKSGDKQKIDALIKKKMTADKIKLIMTCEFKKGRKPKVIKNTAIDIIIAALNADSSGPDDLYEKNGSDLCTQLDGIYRSVAMSVPKENEEQKRSTISPLKLKRIMHNDEITNELIRFQLSIARSQASRYMSAAKACIELVEMKRKCLTKEGEV